MNDINPIMVQTLAKMTGKTEEEVLKFLNVTQVEVPTSAEAVLKKALQEPLNNQPITARPEPPKADAPAMALEPKVVPDEVITEEVPLDQVSKEELEEAESLNTFSTSIRVGSKVRVTWQPNAGKGKINWVGRVGTVIQKLSDSGVSIYNIEFPAGKIPFSRLNKKTGKLERGYSTKKLQQWCDEANIEPVF
jgi:hypothetical protein